MLLHGINTESTYTLHIFIHNKLEKTYAGCSSHVFSCTYKCNSSTHLPKYLFILLIIITQLYCIVNVSLEQESFKHIMILYFIPVSQTSIKYSTHKNQQFPTQIFFFRLKQLKMECLFLYLCINAYLKCMRNNESTSFV